jgi:hypothetical protein
VVGGNIFPILSPLVICLLIVQIKVKEGFMSLKFKCKLVEFLKLKNVNECSKGTS